MSTTQSLTKLTHFTVGTVLYTAHCTVYYEYTTVDDLVALLAFITPGCGLYNTVYTVYMMGLTDDLVALLAFITPGCGFYNTVSTVFYGYNG